MATPKNVFWNNNAFVIYLALIFFIAPVLGYADNLTATQHLTASYHIPTPCDKLQLAPLIESLKFSLATCDNTLLASRIEYRIGVLYTKTKQFQLARSWFVRVLARSQCPVLIRTTALNMLAQLDRLEGKAFSCLEYFGRIIDQLQKDFPGNDRMKLPSALTQLWMSAHLARAEIFQKQQNHASSAREYKSLIDLISQSSFNLPDPSLLPELLDRGAAAYFQAGHLDTYLDLTDQLTRCCAIYPRLPQIRFEAACARFCRTHKVSIDNIKGPAVLPVQIISAVKKNKKHIDTTVLLQTLQQLTEQYNEHPNAAQLIYHYGWLLDALGKTHEATEVFSRFHVLPISDSFSTLQSYGQVCHALLLTEQATELRRSPVHAGSLRRYT